MPDLSLFESRIGKLTCTPSELFSFVTDIRNFERFIPDGTVKDLSIEKESCTFQVASVGQINMKLSEKNPFSRVAYTGTVLKTNDFTLFADINPGPEEKAEVVLKLEAGLNPLLKMMVSPHVARLLDKLIDEMENFREWNVTTE